MKNLTFANQWNADLIDQQYELWLKNPEALDSEWRAFFEGFELAQGPAPSTALNIEKSEASIISLINAYRSIGHTQAKINPLNPHAPHNPALGFAQFGLKEEDLNKKFFTDDYLGGKNLSAKEIIDSLQQTYCGSIGCEYMHIQDMSKRHWLQSHIEPTFNQPLFSQEKCIRILRKINQAEIFERFLHTRYVGQKRFSLEGGETLIAALDAVLEKSPASGVKSVIIGMAHRGRLNVLANILGKSYNFIFKEFTENYIPESIYGDGDVKYHLGYENIHKCESGDNVVITLAANPSHLEAVDPVVEGKARARQRIYAQDVDNIDRTKVLPILIHGDAAIIGQGIVAETLNLSKLEGYRTGGTIHFVINNQIGFTSLPKHARSSQYCTDIGKMIESPIFHVNGDDPLAVVMIMELALKYRQEFGEDVFIDMYCYRKYGHNEADEPAYTQPTLYKQIASHKPVSEYFSEKLIQEGLLSTEESKKIKNEFEAILDDAFKTVKKEVETPPNERKSSKPMLARQPAYSFKPVKTAVDQKTLEKVTKALTHIPKSFNANPKIVRQLTTKWDAFVSGQDIDWGLGEALAFGTLLIEGTPIRLSGQDSERGTFSHRHAVLYDTESLQPYTPLNNLSKDQSRFCVHNSSLSEAAVLGFDFGYSVDYPQILCIWEAQFGDFANGAQSIFDQFIASSESKWQRLSSLVMFLPHGYEGQGPEHSSARLERYLQACAEENIQVCNVTTPAQLFHLLRRQKKQNVIKPLVLMTPKSLLRHKHCVSTVKDFTSGHFEAILDDTTPPKKADRVIFCSGKIYYDLLAHREENNIKDTAIIRLEQLYPLDKETLSSLIKKYNKAKSFVWCQEEPKNMGAWTYIAPELTELLGQTPSYVGRKPSASPATGSLTMHKKEQASILQESFQK